MNQLILSLFLTSLSFFLFVPFSLYAETEIDPSDPISKYSDIIIAIISVGVGSLIATLLVQYWNNKKETNEKRRTVLNNYFNELKKPVSLMDNFIDKLLIYLSSLDKTNGLSNGKKLSEYLAWTYSFDGLEYYKDKVPPFKTYKGIIQEEKINYTKDDISNFFKELQEENCKWIINTDNLTSKQKDEIKKEFNQFENEFHDQQIKSIEFSISLRQYYTDKTLMGEYHAMFEYMMGCFFIIRKITDYLDDKKKILDLVMSYQKNSNFLHEMMIDFESKLIAGDLHIK
jgi:hypothetical protein